MKKYIIVIVIIVLGFIFLIPITPRPAPQGCEFVPDCNKPVTIWARIIGYL